MIERERDAKYGSHLTAGIRLLLLGDVIDGERERAQIVMVLTLGIVLLNEEVNPLRRRIK